MERIESGKNFREIMMLGNYLEQGGIDQTDNEAVLAAAKDLFGEGRPEHEVEEIVNEFFTDQRA